MTSSCGGFLSKFIPAVLVAFFLMACSTGGRKKTAQLRGLIQTGNLNEALALTKSEKFYSDKESKLLKLLEQGGVHHLRGEYYQSLKILDKAKNLSDKLFTKSLSKKIKSVLANDRSDNYYGEKYERSSIRFYQALNHFLLSLQGFYEAHTVKLKGEKEKLIPKKVLTFKKKRQHLQSARAVILEWDSLLDDYRTGLAGKSVYKDDMMAKLLGALIHERMGSRSELNIARQLYRDAKVLLIRNYSSYPTFNSSFRKFEKNFEKFPKLGQKKVQKQFISQTFFSKQLVNYINNRLKNLKGKKHHNLHILITEGLIHPKKAKRIDFPIGFNTLPFGVPNKRDFLTYVRKTMAISSVSIPTISFELPYIDFSQNARSWQLLIKSKEGKTLQVKPLILSNPLSEIAHQTLEDQRALIKTKTGLRVAGKHLSALASSYLTYRSAIKKGTNDFLASTLAAGMYAIANKGIRQSERADLRHWTTLPRNIWISSLNLSPGQYRVVVKLGSRLRDLGVLKIEKKQKNFSRFHIF